MNSLKELICEFCLQAKACIPQPSTFARLKEWAGDLLGRWF